MEAIERVQLPSRAFHYLLKQRAELRTKSVTRLFNSALMRRICRGTAGAKSAYLALGVPIEKVCNRRRIECELTHQLRNDFGTIAPVLPASAERVLDIGAGVGAINAFTYRRCNEPDVHLLDKGGESQFWNAGYNESASGFSYYNDFEAACDLLTTNGVPRSKIHVHDQLRQGFPECQFDAIYSFLAWGFHFPVSEYLEASYGALKEGGVLVIDVRRGTKGIDTLREVFGKDPSVLSAAPKYERVWLSK